jgi:NitT/TauT family transport system substrate-binding protein
MVTSNREFVRNHPVATKRSLRAILKAADLCAGQPERAARGLIDRGFAPRYDDAMQTLNDVLYDKRFDSADFMQAQRVITQCIRFRRRSSPRTPIGAF